MQCTISENKHYIAMFKEQERRGTMGRIYSRGMQMNQWGTVREQKVTFIYICSFIFKFQFIS